MKCVCGFKDKHEEDPTPPEEVRWSGTEFTRIEGVFHVKDPHSYTRTFREVLLKACPVCKTVQMEDF